VFYCYGRNSILISASKHVRDLGEYLASDEVLTAAVLNRLLNSAF